MEESVLIGRVQKGNKRGEKLGFPTFNLEIKDLKIKDGVYISKSKVLGKDWSSVTFIGQPETFNDKKRRIETHILNFSKDIYNETVKLTLFRKIRGNKKFNSVEELTKQIKKDIKEANVFWNNRNKNANKKNC